MDTTFLSSARYSKGCDFEDWCQTAIMKDLTFLPGVE